MNNKPVLFFDSGTGGLIYCGDFMKKNPQEEICCVADRQNFPYGQKTKEELSSILVSLTEKLIKLICPKIIVLACNTATVSSIEILRRAFPAVPFVGTVPAVKPAASMSIKRKIGLLGTTRTIEDPYSLHLADENIFDNTDNEKKARCEIIGAAAPELVEFVENNLEKADKNEKTAMVKKYVNFFKEKGVDALVLGCTHFLYLLDEFKKEASPSIAVYDSLEGITKRIAFLLDEKNLRAENNFNPAHRLILTGAQPPQTSWEKRAVSLGLKISLLQ